MYYDKKPDFLEKPGFERTTNFRLPDFRSLGKLRKSSLQATIALVPLPVEPVRHP